MLERVPVEAKTLIDYEPIVGSDVTDEIRKLANRLKGARVVHINATSFGGGVAEILVGLVPLMQNVGLEAEWQVIEGTDEFFNVTKASHNGLQGMELDFTSEMKDIWKQYNQKNAQAFEGDYDFIVVHDPQPAGLMHYHGRAGGKHWIWRCHIDTSHPNLDFWNFYTPFINVHDAGIFTMQQYVGPGVELDLWQPTIQKAGLSWIKPLAARARMMIFISCIISMASARMKLAASRLHRTCSSRNQPEKVLDWS